MAQHDSYADVPIIDLAAQRRRMGDGIERAMMRVLEHGRFIGGPEVVELERRLEAFSGARHCIACANGTDAITLALMALGIGAGHAVLLPTFTFVATAGAVVQVGATPVLVDVLPDTFNIDPDSLKRAIGVARASRLEPKAVIAVDIFGLPADYTSIRAVAKEAGLAVIADAAQSFGARHKGALVGTLGDITTTSFYPTKPLGGYGDGGAMLTDDPVLADRLRLLRSHGQRSNPEPAILCGLNSRLDTLQAAILIEKLAVFEAELLARDRIADGYTQRLADVVRCPVVPEGLTSVWAQYTIVVRSGRDELILACSAAGIGTAVHYRTPVHVHEAYKHYPRATPTLPVAERLAKQVLSLPMHADLDLLAQTRVADAVLTALTGSNSRIAYAHSTQAALGS